MHLNLSPNKSKFKFRSLLELFGEKNESVTNLQVEKPKTNTDKRSFWVARNFFMTYWSLNEQTSLVSGFLRFWESFGWEVIHWKKFSLSVASCSFLNLKKKKSGWNFNLEINWDYILAGQMTGEKKISKIIHWKWKSFWKLVYLSLPE